MTKLSRAQPPRKTFFKKGNFLLGFAWRYHDDSGEKYSPVLGRIAVALFALMLVAWLGLATAAWAFVKYARNFETVRFVDVAFPHRWDEYQKARGNAYIAQAEELLKANEIRPAFQLLRVGVAKAPENVRGRLLLAQFLSAFGRSDVALRTLQEGMIYGRDDFEYLRSYVRFLLDRQEDALVQQLADELLPAKPELNERNQFIALAAATAKYLRGNFDQAEDLIAAYQLTRTVDGRVLQSRIDWDRGYRDLALSRMRALVNERPNDDQLYVIISSFLREAGARAEAERYALLRRLNSPTSPGPRIALMSAFRESENASRLQREVADFLADFSEDPSALIGLANFAANAGDIELSRRVLGLCEAQGFDTSAPSLMLVEAHIVAKDYRAALALVERIERSGAEWAEQQAGVLAGLRAIAAFGTGNSENGQLSLRNFLSQRTIRPENLIAVSNRLLAVGAREQARQVLEQAVASDELNQNALSNLITLDLDLGNTEGLKPNLERLLGMRRPSLVLLRQAEEKLSSDLFLFAERRIELLEAISAALNKRSEELPSGRQADRSELNPRPRA
jgi:hypothetical protein